ncbi:MAG: hypothetical protein V4596_02810 [Bdellovibrionota bacterium]
MKIALILITFLISLKAFAVKIEYTTYENAQAEYVNITKILCSPTEENICLQICEDKSFCIKEEGLCTNCAGSNDFFMRLLFTRAKDNFVVTNQVLDQSQMLGYLTEQRYVLATYKSVYNFYKAWGSEEVKNDFASFCPPQDTDPILIINLNEKNQPREVAGVICSDKKGQSYVRTVQDKNTKKEAIRLTN